MRKIFTFCSLVFTVLFMNAQQAAFENNSEVAVQFMSPISGGQYYNVNTQLTLRPGPLVNIDMLLDSPEMVVISGSISGIHDYAMRLASDGKTIIIDPRIDFELLETVSVNIEYGILVLEGGYWPSINYSFQTSKLLPADRRENQEEIEIVTESEREWFEPEILIGPEPGVAPGNIFINTTSSSKTLAIMDSVATQPPLWWMESGLLGNDFKVNRNEKLTFHDRIPKWWLMMDEYTQIVDTFVMTNGYGCDNHDFQILPNQHYFMFAYDDQEVDMSEVVAGGNPNALVEGFVIQERDENDDLIFEWRSWDWFQITDNELLDLTGADLNIFHINAIEIDSDDNLLISSRHISEITKINKSTGQIMWRLGNNSQNQFTFVGTQTFSYQHDVRRLENGNILLFDNANFSTQNSRAVELNINTTTMQATLVWEFEHPDNLFGSSMGGCGRLGNGNTIIYWGNVGLDQYGARVSEVDMDGNILLEIAWPISVDSYRVPKYEWFFDDSVIGCADPIALNYEPELPVQSFENCLYADEDEDGFTTEEGDCDDSDADINPDAVEIPYDGIDQDCSGADLVDVDGDGYSPEQGDCDDNEFDINPGATEIPYDGIDQDCVDGDLDDVDGDGFSPDDGDCDDNNGDINPDGEEIPYDGIDQDCEDGDLVDVDGDGFSPDDGDCDDNEFDINPDAEEIPNDGIDQDCVDGDLIVSVDEFELAFGRIIWNEAAGILSWNAPYSQTTNLMIFDGSGRLCVDRELGANDTQVNLPGLSQGVYTVVLRSEDFISHKIAVTH
ncbi:MAG: hypothetical protein ACJAV7_001116 [Flavobacteriales bacterium]|jgi:hypothetical protein